MILYCLQYFFSVCGPRDVPQEGHCCDVRGLEASARVTIAQEAWFHCRLCFAVSISAGFTLVHSLLKGTFGSWKQLATKTKSPNLFLMKQHSPFSHCQWHHADIVSGWKNLTDTNCKADIARFVVHRLPYSRCVFQVSFLSPSHRRKALKSSSN